MAKKKIDKTNAMRILDRSKVSYEIMTYTVDESDLSGEHAAAELGLDPERVFKTLVLKGDKKGHLVAVIPVNATLDLKALARVSGNKSVEMIHVKDLFDLTGYIRGGCSPIGMKKVFPTYLHQSCSNFDTIVFSAGQRGMQIVLPHADLVKVTGAEICDIIQE
ncbi:MAG: Cys-tRNA(Pro) deacylase [Clostridia bacterium]|nr:Cys-tRNA(Pro) deacylase [Clostridia bacterium]